MRSTWAQARLAGTAAPGLNPSAAEPVALELIKLIDKLISEETSTETAVEKTSSIILSQQDVAGAFQILVGLLLSAAETPTEEKVSKTLADYLVLLAQLPDAVNKTFSPIAVDIGGGELKHIAPGEVVSWDNKTLWRDLPDFSWNVTESFQGPELYMASLRAPASPQDAQLAWKSLNRFFAYVSMHPAAKKVRELSNMSKLGLRALPMALEYSPSTGFGRNSDLHAPGAEQWLQIAGDEIERLCLDGGERMTAGGLWIEQGGTDACDNARLLFWKRRLGEFTDRSS